MTYASVDTKLMGILALRGKRTSTLEQLVKYLTALRQSADQASLGLPLSLKILLSIINCHFDERTRSMSSNPLLSIKFVPIDIWHRYDMRMFVHARVDR